MMGQQQPQKELFSYQVDLDKRVRSEHPLRRVAAAIDFTFARAEVQATYGYNGNVSVDPAVVLKLMFLLFFDNVRSERHLMELLPERLDYLWFLGYGINDELPHHSVLSKARARWGGVVFEKLFIRTVAACMAAGLVEGKKIHVDGSLITANAAMDSIVSSSPELLAALRATYQQEAAKLEEPLADCSQMSTTDPDAQLARRPSQGTRLRYKQHRVVDDAKGVITAQVTTGGAVPEDGQLMGLVEQHHLHTGVASQTVVADSQYGTSENYLACADREIQAHMADWKTHHQGGTPTKQFSSDQFDYDPTTDTYRCPAGQTLHRYQRCAHKPAWEYKAKPSICAHCPLRTQCTSSRSGRRVRRYERQDQLDQLRALANSPAARKDRRRRQHLIEGSFADAANNHGFKRSRWRRLWRQQIQNHLIAACQNLRILLRNGMKNLTGAVSVLLSPQIWRWRHRLQLLNGLWPSQLN
jgi:transposase